MIGPDPKTDLCTGTLDCKMEVKGALGEGQAAIAVGGQFSITADGKTIKKGHRGVRLGCLPDWQTIKGDDKKVVTCGMVNNFLDGMFHFLVILSGFKFAVSTDSTSGKHNTTTCTTMPHNITRNLTGGLAAE